MKLYLFSSTTPARILSWEEQRLIFKFGAPGTPEYYSDTRVPDALKADSLRQQIDPLVKQGAVFGLDDTTLQLRILRNPKLDQRAGTLQSNQIMDVVLQAQAASPEVARRTLIQVFTPETLKIYNAAFQDLKEPLTADAIRRMHTRYEEMIGSVGRASGGAPTAVLPDPQSAGIDFTLRWQALLEKTPLGEIIRKAGTEEGVLNDDLLNVFNEAMGRYQANVHERLRTLQDTVAEEHGAPLESVEDLPWYMKLGALAAMIMYAVQNPGKAALLAAADIATRLSIHSEGLFLGVIPDQIKKFSSPLGKPIPKELREMYSSLDTREREKSLSLSLALDVSAGDIASYVTRMGGEDIRTSPETSLFAQRMKEVQNWEQEDPELRFLGFNLKEKGVNAVNFNESLYDALVFIGNGDFKTGLEILRNDRDGKSLGYYIWVESQQRIEEGKKNPLQVGVEYTVLGFDWITDPRRKAEIKNALSRFGNFIVKISKDGANFVINTVKAGYQGLHDILMVQKPGTHPPQYEFRFKSNLIHLKDKAFETLEDALEFIGIGRSFSLDEVPFAPAGHTVGGTPQEEYDAPIRTQIEAMQYDQEFYEAMKSMIELMPTVDEAHEFHIGGIMLQTDLWKWLVSGSSGSVDENMWTGLFQAKGRELLMVYGQMLEKRNERLGNVLAGPFSTPADVVTAIDTEQKRLAGIPKEKDAAAEYLEYLNAAKKAAALPSATASSVMDALKARVNTLAADQFKILYLRPYKEKCEYMKRRIRKAGGLDEDMWFFHIWDNTFGSLSEDEVERIKGIPMQYKKTPLVEVSTLALTARDAAGNPLEIPGSAEPADRKNPTGPRISYEQKMSELVSTGIYHIFSGPEWWDTVGMRNRGEYSAKLRSYGVMHYMRFIASVNAVDNPNPDEVITYVSKLNAHFLDLGKKKEAITKPELDDFVEKLRTFTAYMGSSDKEVYERT